jgi:hypothetical protein
VSYEYRIEDPRIGRFFSVDPLAYSFPWNSPYAFSENDVISAVELEGLEKDKINKSDPDFNRTVEVKQPNTQPNLTVDHLDPKVISSLPTSPVPDIKHTINEIKPDALSVKQPVTSSNFNLANYNMNPILAALYSADRFMYSFTKNHIFWGSGKGGDKKHSDIQLTKGSIHTYDFAQAVQAMLALGSKLNNNLPSASSSGKGMDKAKTFGRQEIYGQDQTDCSGWHKVDSTPTLNKTTDTTIKEIWHNLRSGRKDTFVQKYNKKNLLEKGRNNTKPDTAYFK